MPGTALWVDSFTCLPLSPFIWLPLSPSLHVCHGSPGGRIHLSPLVPLHLSPISVGGRIDLSPFVSLYLSPVVSQPGCLSGWTDSFVSLCLPLFVSRCLPFICLPLSLSLDVALTLRGFLHFPRFCPFGGVWFAFGFGPGFGHSSSCGCWGQGPLSALHLDFDFAWARGGSSSLSIVGYTLSVRSVPRYESGALRCTASALC